MADLLFSSVIRIRDLNPYILVSAARAKAIKPDWRKPLPVLLRIDGKPVKPWRTNMMPLGDGSFYLYLHGDIRKASGTKVGDRVQAEVSFDARYRSGPLHRTPAWFKEAFLEHQTATEHWQALSPSRKKEILRYFSRLKAPETRARNLDKALHVLSGNKGRFMGRTWTEGA